MQKFEPIVSVFSPKKVTTKLSKLTKSLSIIEAVLIVAIVGMLIFLFTYKGNASKTSITPPKGISLSQKAIFEEDHGQYDKAEDAWQSQLSSSSSKEDKINIYFEQASTAIQFKNYSDATNYANKAKALDPNSPVPYVALANISLALGNKVQAKSYWQQAINNLNPNDPAYNIKLATYKHALESIN